jgi:hypothetical protein
MSEDQDEIIWMSYSEFLKHVEDIEFARGFLAYCIQSGYEFADFQKMEEIQYMPNHQVIDLAKYVWPMFYLREVPSVNDWNN